MYVSSYHSSAVKVMPIISQEHKVFINSVKYADVYQPENTTEVYQLSRIGRGLSIQKSYCYLSCSSEDNEMSQSKQLHVFVSQSSFFTIITAKCVSEQTLCMALRCYSIKCISTRFLSTKK